MQSGEVDVIGSATSARLLPATSEHLLSDFMGFLWTAHCIAKGNYHDVYVLHKVIVHAIISRHVQAKHAILSQHAQAEHATTSQVLRQACTISKSTHQMQHQLLYTWSQRHEPPQSEQVDHAL